MFADTFFNLAVLLGSLLVLAPPAPPIRVSRETTYLTEPLAADGLPDYRKWLLDKRRAGVTPENNAAVPLLRAVVPYLYEDEDPARLYGALGLSLPDPTVMRVPSFDQKADFSVQRLLVIKQLVRRGTNPQHDIDNPEAFAAWRSGVATQMGVSINDLWLDEEVRATNIVAACAKAPWPADGLPMLSIWCERHARQIERLQQAAERTHFYLPNPRPSDLSDPFDQILLTNDLMTLQSARDCLSIQAMKDAQQGDFAAAWAKCRSMYKLSSLPGATLLVDQLGQFGGTNETHEVVLQLLAMPQLSAEVSLEIAEYYAAQARRHHLSATMDGERAFDMIFILDFLGLRVGPNGPLEAADLFVDESYDELRKLPVDVETVLVEINGWYDRLADVAGQTTYKQARTKLAALQREIEVTPTVESLRKETDRQVVGRGVAMTLFRPSLSSVALALNLEARHNTRLSLMETASALAYCRAKEGKYPETLTQLVPFYAAELPADGFGEQPLTYTKTQNGYLLVSLGENGRDEGGMCEDTQSYKGYSLNYFSSEKRNLPALCELLGEELPAGERGPRDDFFEPTESPNLKERIPKGSDDISIRMPPVPPDWDALLK